MKRSDITDEDVCRAYAEWQAAQAGHLVVPDSVRMVDLVLMERFGAPEKVVYAAMSRAYDRGLTEFGVSMRSGWLTEKGEALLAK